MTVSTETKLSANDREAQSVPLAKAGKVYSEPKQRVSSILTDVELIRACTPIVLAMVGCLLGVFAVVAKPNAEIERAGLGLASTAIAGAAGLAQSHNRQA